MFSDKPVTQEFDRFRKFLASHTGIALTDSKSYLVESRLRNILTEQGLQNIDLLLDFLDKNPTSTLVDKVVDAMTTHETFWFRDNNFYNYLRTKLIPELLEKTPAGQSIEIWSAASSSGQEAYSLGILADQCLHALDKQHKLHAPLHILGTDVSHQMIVRARSATYSSLELSRGLSESVFSQYFEKNGDGKATLKDAIRNRVQFKLHNLMDTFDGLGMFDIVLCRNVLIYFDEATVQDILRRMHQVIKPDGILFLSSSETINGLDELYKAEATYPGFLYRVIK